MTVKRPIGTVNRDRNNEERKKRKERKGNMSLRLMAVTSARES
jgi:hypothetical protein